MKKQKQPNDNNTSLFLFASDNLALQACREEKCNEYSLYRLNMILREQKEIEFPLGFTDDGDYNYMYSSFPPTNNKNKMMNDNNRQHTLSIPPWSPSRQQSQHRNENIKSHSNHIAALNSIDFPIVTRQPVITNKKSNDFNNNTNDGWDNKRELSKKYHESFDGIDSFFTNKNSNVSSSSPIKHRKPPGRSKSFDETFSYFSHAATKSHAGDSSLISRTDTLSVSGGKIQNPDTDNFGKYNNKSWRQNNHAESSGSLELSEVFPDNNLENFNNDHDQNFVPLEATLAKLKEKHNNIVVLDARSFSKFSTSDSLLQTSPKDRKKDNNNITSTSDHEFFKNRAKSCADFEFDVVPECTTDFEEFDEPDWANSSCSGDEDFAGDGAARRKQRRAGSKKVRKKSAIKIKASDLEKIPENIDELKALMKKFKKHERTVINPAIASHISNDISKHSNVDALISTSINTESTTSTGMSSLSSATRLRSEHEKKPSKYLSPPSPRTNHNTSENFCYPDEWHQSSPKSGELLHSTTAIKDAISIDLLIDEDNTITSEEPKILNAHEKVNVKSDRFIEADLLGDSKNNSQNNTSEREPSISLDDIFIIEEVKSADDKKKKEWRSTGTSKSVQTKAFQKSCNGSTTLIMAPFRSVKRTNSNNQKMIRRVPGTSMSSEHSPVDSNSVQQPYDTKPRTVSQHTQQKSPTFENDTTTESRNLSAFSRSKHEIDELYDTWKNELKYTDTQQGNKVRPTRRYPRPDETELPNESPRHAQDTKASPMKKQTNRNTKQFEAGNKSTPSLQTSKISSRDMVSPTKSLQNGIVLQNRRKSIGEPKALSPEIRPSRAINKSTRSKSIPHDRPGKNGDSSAEIVNNMRTVRKTRPTSIKQHLEIKDQILGSSSGGKSARSVQTYDVSLHEVGARGDPEYSSPESKSRFRSYNGERSCNRLTIKTPVTAERRSKSRSRSELAENTSLHSSPEYKEHRKTSVSIPKEDRRSRPTADERSRNRSSGRSRPSVHETGEAKTSPTKKSDRRSVSRGSTRKEEGNVTTTRKSKLGTDYPSSSPVAVASALGREDNTLPEIQSHSSPPSKSRRSSSLKEEQKFQGGTTFKTNEHHEENSRRLSSLKKSPTYSSVEAIEHESSKKGKHPRSKSCSPQGNKLKPVLRLGPATSDNPIKSSSVHLSTSKRSGSRSRSRVQDFAEEAGSSLSATESPRKIKCSSPDQRQIRTGTTTRTRSRSRGRISDAGDQKVKLVFSEDPQNEGSVVNQRKLSVSEHSYDRRKRSSVERAKKNPADNEEKSVVDRKKKNLVDQENRTLADQRRKQFIDSERITDANLKGKNISKVEKGTSVKQERRSVSDPERRPGSPKRPSSRAKTRTQESTQGVNEVQVATEGVRKLGKSSTGLDAKHNDSPRRTTSRSRSQILDLMEITKDSESPRRGRKKSTTSTGREMFVSPRRGIQRSSSQISESDMKSIVSSSNISHKERNAVVIKPKPNATPGRSRSRSRVASETERRSKPIASESPRKERKISVDLSANGDEILKNHPKLRPKSASEIKGSILRNKVSASIHIID